VADVDGINVNLTVCTGVMTQEIPDVTGMTYKEANLKLQQAGFVVEMEEASSDTISEGFVIKTSPAGGESIATGSTVYLVYSSGPEIQYVTMKNLIGMSEANAKSTIRNLGLSFGSTSYVYSDDYAEGRVVWQSTKSGTRAEVGSKVYLQVSKGPRNPETTDEG